MTWARRTDANQAAIFATLRACGWRVHDTSRLPGFVDGIAWHEGRRRLALVECKTLGGKLTKLQMRLANEGWPVTVIRTREEAIAL